MNGRRSFGIAFVMLSLALVVPATAESQQRALKEQLIGAWILVSNNNTLPDGTKRELWGPNPKGILILDPSGRYAQTQMRSNRAKFKSGNRLQATPEESRTAMQESLAQFGTWSVDEPTKTITLNIEGSVFPNSEGNRSRRVILGLTADELRVTNPGPSAGGKSEAVFRRATGQ